MTRGLKLPSGLLSSAGDKRTTRMTKSCSSRLPGAPEDGVVPDILFLKVPEAKSLKNRLHLDLRPNDQSTEVVRLESLGASRVSVGQGDDVTWVVMSDPEGNEFCVLKALPA